MDQRVITCDQKPSAHCAKEFKNPFVNFKIEVMNNLAKKRKLDVDSCETPARKSFMPMPLSPDLGCVMDYCSPPASGESVSSLALSQPASISLGTQESASSQLHCGHVKCQSKPVGAEDTELYSLRSESNLFSVEYTFDLDVDNTLSLSPISTCTAGGMSDHSKSFNSPNSSTSQDEPLPVRTVAEGQELDRGDKSVLEEFEKYVNLSVYGEEEDKCYFSSSYLKGCELVTPELLPTTSSSFLEIGKVETAEDERRPESCHTLAAPHGPSVSFAVEDLSPPSGLLLNAVNLPEEILESDVEEVWDIGPPIFESSVCHDEPSAADSEHNREVSGEEQGEVSEVLKPQSQTTLSDVETTLDTTLDTSYEKTILNVQVSRFSWSH